MRSGWMVVCLALALAACGGDDEAASDGGTKTPDGSSKVATTRPTIYVKIGADGTTNLSKLDRPNELAVSANLSNTPREAVAALTRTAQAELEAHGIKTAGAEGSNVALTLTVDPRARWKYVQWTLQAGAAPGARIRTIDLVDPTGKPPLRIVLPTDREMAEEVVVKEGDLEPAVPSDASDPRAIKVKVFRRNLAQPDEQYTLIKLDDDSFPLPRGPQAEQDDAYWSAMKALRAALKARLASTQATIFELVAPPPKGGSVPYADVFRILRMARDLGMERILLEGAAMP